jgi:hypothetical protein
VNYGRKTLREIRGGKRKPNHKNSPASLDYGVYSLCWPLVVSSVVSLPRDATLGTDLAIGFSGERTEPLRMSIDLDFERFRTIARSQFQIRACTLEKDLSAIDRCFQVIDEQPVKLSGRLQEVFAEDFRKN